MLTPYQIAEMAAAKYPLMETKHVMGQLKECIELHNQTQLDRREGYIAAFTDAMELMSKEWVSVEERLPEKSGGYLCVINYDNGPKTTCMSFNLKRESFVLLHKRVTHWQPLPEPPVLRKDKKI